MSELKDYSILDIEAIDDERLVKSESGKIQETRVYIKSEADKVLAEKDKELRRHKYKRCLAMARVCEERHNYLTCLENYQMTDKEYQQVIGDYWDRWNKRWLELAEKFKEAK